ncbi:costars family protein-like, partial [Morus notabilis]|uniref:costars family protein-like n=1 Tax=Morus notabilis TaxID=981085 RepID=UPI000CECEBDE
KCIYKSYKENNNCTTFCIHLNLLFCFKLLILDTVLTLVLISLKVTFGVLFHDDKCANIFEALVGTLRAAKKRKFVAYDGELLLQGVHDNVEIMLKPSPQPATSAGDAVAKA